MNASDIMTRDVGSVGQDASIGDAVSRMLDHGISGLPVVDGDGKAGGMLIEGDLLRRDEPGTERHRPRWLEFLLGPGRLADEYDRTHGRKVGEIMTNNVISVVREKRNDPAPG